MLAAARQVIGKQGEIDVVAVTHCHADHIGNLAAIITATSAKVYVHPDDLAHVAAGTSCLPTVICRVGAALVGLNYARPLPGGASIIDADTLETTTGLSVIPTPGHTPGHVSFGLVDAGILFAGDAATSRRGNIALRLTPCDVDQAQARASFERLRVLNRRAIGFGHGEPIRWVAGRELPDDR